MLFRSMSHPQTGVLTAAALTRAGATITYVDELTDVDTVEDIAVVRAACRPSSRFARAAAGV